MSINFTIRKNDTARSLNYSLTLGGAAIDLSTATSVVLTINNGTNVYSRAATINSPAESGSVSYDLVAEDSAKAGVAYMDFTINYSDGTILRVPTKGHILMDVRENSAGVNALSEL